MDKYDINLKIEQIKKMYDKKDFYTAAEIADYIDVKKIKNNSLINIIADSYEETGQYDKAIDVLLLAYERSPLGRQLAYRLTILSIKAEQLQEAEDYYNDFISMAPKDLGQYILKYEIARLKGESIDERIGILEEYVSIEMDEKWQYELAKLYHEAGYSVKCVEQCDEIILWFSDGKYVERAMELKMLYAPLTKQQSYQYEKAKEEHEEKIPPHAGINVQDETHDIEQAEADDIEQANSDDAEQAESDGIEQTEADGIERAESDGIEQAEANGIEQAETDDIEQDESDDIMQDEIKDIVQDEKEVAVTEDEEEEIEDLFQGVTFEEEIGGQIGLYIEEPEEVEEQVEGQMTISDFLDACADKGNHLKEEQPRDKEDVTLNDECKEIFCRYLSIEGIEEQLAACIHNLTVCYDRDGSSKNNNIIIMGDAKSGRTSLAVNLIKLVNRKRGRRGRKIAKVRGAALNNKGLEPVLPKLLGADLIIEQAASMNPTAVDELVTVMNGYTGDMLIVLEDNNSAIERLLNANSVLKGMFGNSINIQGPGVKEWVEVAKDYALQQEYTIDDMGILALYVKVGNLCSKCSEVKAEDIQKIIDNAINKNQKSKLGKIFSAFSGKKGKDELAVLKEADFIHDK